jgi:SAM-dependent methyltransferase
MSTLRTPFESSFITVEPEHPGLEALRAACDRLEALAGNRRVADVARYHRVVAAIHELCHALFEAESAGVPARVLRELTERARKVHSQSPFILRLQEWPRGYPGDFETIERLCQADNRAEPGTLSHLFETYALTSAIAQQHRNKVLAQAAAIREASLDNPQCRVLSLGCGSCPDVRSVTDDVADVTFVLCDSDRDALAYSRACLQPIDRRCHFVQGVVPRLLRRVRPFAPFDLILAGGLFDYLSDRFIVRTLNESWHELLAPGGKILFTNIAHRNPYRVWMEYIASWPLIERSEEDLTILCASAAIPIQPSLMRDATGLSILAELHKATN